MASEIADESNPKAPRIELKGKVFDRVRYKADDPKYLCGDCEAADGEIHDLGCDLEDCPRCGGQLISCGCFPFSEE
jgi:hypothetical protein